VVNAGTLATTTTSTGGGDYTIADSAALACVQAASATQRRKSQRGHIHRSVAQFDLGNFGTPAPARLP